MNINKFDNVNTFEKFKAKKVTRKKPDDKRIARKVKKALRYADY